MQNPPSQLPARLLGLAAAHLHPLKPQKNNVIDRQMAQKRHRSPKSNHLRSLMKHHLIK